MHDWFVYNKTLLFPFHHTADLMDHYHVYRLLRQYREKLTGDKRQIVRECESNDLRFLRLSTNRSNMLVVCSKEKTNNNGWRLGRVLIRLRAITKSLVKRTKEIVSSQILFFIPPTLFYSITNWPKNALSFEQIPSR